MPYADKEYGKARRAERRADPNAKAKKKAYDTAYRAARRKPQPSDEELAELKDQRKKAEIVASRAYAERWRQDRRLNNPKLYMLNCIKGHAKRKGIPFTLTPDDFEIPEFCPVFPRLRLEMQSGGQTRRDNQPSLDRVIPSLGYVPGNVRVISFRANRLKQDASEEEVAAILDYIRTNAPKPH